MFHVALVAGLLAAMACRQALLRVEEYEPTSDPGIELASFVDRDWSEKRLRPTFSYRAGKYEESWSGFHADSDGTIWAFHYEAPSRDAGRCDAADLSAGSAEFAACLYADSTLAARLTPRERERFLRSAANLVDEGRLGGRGRISDVGGLSLGLDGPGTKKGAPIVVARCNPREQLASDDARYFISLFHRIARAVPRFSKLNPTCYSRHYGDEIVPGVPGWWVQ